MKMNQAALSKKNKATLKAVLSTVSLPILWINIYRSHRLEALQQKKGGIKPGPVSSLA